jgi:peroxiredoxin Q/BCP
LDISVFALFFIRISGSKIQFFERYIMLQAGDHAPDFNLKDQTGQPIALKSFKGKQKVVLYFYPRDNTPGCTAEACAFRDAIHKFKNKDVTVLGVSTDSVASHVKFAEKFELPFHLLSDFEKKVSQEYGVFKEKNMYGKKVKGIVRTTFVINEDGTIKKVFPKVKVEGHVDQVLEALE